MEQLLTRAQAAGQIRADATGEDIRLMMCGLGSVMQMIAATAGAATSPSCSTACAPTLDSLSCA